MTRSSQEHSPVHFAVNRILISNEEIVPAFNQSRYPEQPQKPRFGKITVLKMTTNILLCKEIT